jgi:hypothetical protein
MPEPKWTELRDAYGSAEDLPDLLSELVPDPKAPVWSELWGRICHQSSPYSASPYVLPFLLGAAAEWKPLVRAMPLALAACIVAAPETKLEGYEACVGQLRDLALETLMSSDLNRTDRIYVIQSVLAFEGNELWGTAFERLNDGEFNGNCPTCKTDLCFVIGQYGFFCSAGDWVREPALPRTEIHSRRPGELPEPGKRLYALCSADPLLGDWICHLFGSCTCPTCSESLDVAILVAAFGGPAENA